MQIVFTVLIVPTHPADDLEEALWQFVGLFLQQRNVRIHSKQPQLPVFLHAVKPWPIREELALQINQSINISVKLLNGNITTQQH